MSASRPHLASLVEDFEKAGAEIAVVGYRGLRQRRISYRRLASLSRSFASELQGRRIIKGDRVILWGENSANWVSAFFGCLLNGSIPVPLDAASRAEFVKNIITDVKPRLILADGAKLDQLTSDIPSLALESWPDCLPYPSEYQPVVLSELDPLQIVFTSGTTGSPKGIVHTHKNVLASLRPIETEVGRYLRYEKLFHPIRILLTLPLSHVFGQFMGLWIPVLLRAEIHFQHRLVASELLEYISLERISVLATVPRVLDLLQAHLVGRIPGLLVRLREAATLKAPSRWWRFRDVHSLFGFKFWAFVCGGASLSTDSEQFWNGLGFIVIQGYGMTETTALVSLNHPFKLARGTVGQVLPGREVQLSESGEVLVRGETVASSTWQNGTLQQSASDWLATGDLAEFDESGNLRFRGRAKEVIVTAAGLNIYPEDLEAALLHQPGVRACAVVEVQADAGPEPVAVLLTQGGAQAAQIVAAANTELADFQQLRRWMVWPELDLPRTSTGKVLKREIVKRLADGELPSSPEEDLNLDSLGRVQLQAQMEAQSGLSFSDVALQGVQTKAELQALVRQAPLPVSRDIDHAYPRWPWAPVVQAVRSLFLHSVALPLLRFLTKAKRRTELTAAPREPVLIVANHVTSYDLPFILYALPRRMRGKVAVAMSGEMILDWRMARGQGHWFLNAIAPFQYFLVSALFNIFPLPQTSGFRHSFRHAGAAMDHGYNVLVFPEGKRSDNEAMLPFKTGTGLLWQESGAPALPVYVSGLGTMKATGGRWFRTGMISVSSGALIQFDARRSPQQATELLHREISRLANSSMQIVGD